MADPFSWPDVLAPLLRGDDLSTAQIDGAMSTILSGEATDAQIAAFATGLRAKGETPAELAALVRTMLRFSERVDVTLDGPGGPVIDTCGTGGDRSSTVNVSTLAAIVAAGAGVRVCKHGGRAASSKCGSVDLLEELGVVIDLGAAGVARCIEEVGIGFCFAQKFHPAFRFVAPVRRELGVGTTFNVLGPLANPARVRRQVIGIADPAMAERMIETLAELGTERAFVFFGHDGLDEITTTDVSTVRELRDGQLHRFVLDPTDLGIPRATRGALVGGDASTNAAIARKLLEGESGPVRDVVVLNAAAALVVADAVDDFAEGVERAGATIDAGRAAATLEAWVQVSRAARDAER